MNKKMKRDVAIIILYNLKKEILLQHRDNNMRRLPGYWAFFGGGIDKNETPEEAVKRETLEELNYQLIKPKLVLMQNFKDKYHQGVKHVFVEKYNPNKKLKLLEGQAMDWFKIFETKKLKIIDHDRMVLEYIKENYKF
ncbi:MAG: NUDIX domain-containing protein [Patescibacteria group bacterium]